MIVRADEVSDRFLAAITGSHKLSTVAQVLNDGENVLDLRLTDGGVTLDATADQRGRLDATAHDDGALGLVPTGPDDPLAPYGNEIQVARGIEYGDGTTEEVSLGIFRLDEVEVDDSGEELSLRISAQDRSIVVADAKFEDPFQIDNGTVATTAIKDLIRDILPDVRFRFAESDVELPMLAAEEGDDRWALAQGIATALGADLYFDGVGDCILQPVDSMLGEVIPLVEGVDGVLIGVNKVWSRLDAFNRVIVTGDNPDVGGTDVPRGVATDDDPNSPTYYFGPFGKVPRFVSSEYVLTDTQAADMAAGVLKASLGVSQRVDFGAVVDPRMAPLGVAEIVRERAGVNETHLVDSVTIPLTAEESMSGTTRATQRIEI